MEKIKRRSIKTACSLLLSLLLLLTGMPLEGVGKAFAAGEPKVTAVYLYLTQVPRQITKKVELIFEGLNLKDAEFSLNGKEFGNLETAGYGKKQDNKGSRVSFIGVDPQILSGDELEFSVTRGEPSESVLVKINFVSKIPEIDQDINEFIYAREKFEIKGKNLDLNSDNIQKVEYHVGTAHYEKSDNSVISTGNKVTIPGNIFLPIKGHDQVMTIKVFLKEHANKYDNDTEETKVKSALFYRVEGLTIKEKFPGLDDFRVLPEQGYYGGGEILNIFAWDKGKKEPILNQDVFGEDMRVRLEKKVPGGEPIHVETDFVGIKTIEYTEGNKKENKKAVLLVRTKGIEKKDLGSYDVIIYNKKEAPYDKHKRLQEAVLKEGFEYVNQHTNMTVSDVRPPQAKDDETPLVRISGRDILNIDRVPMLFPKSPSSEPISFMPDPLKGILDDKPPINKEKYLVVDYKLPSGGSTYAGIDVEKIYRKISVQIGTDATPIEKPIVTADPGIETPPTDQEPHFINTKAKEDKVIFRLKNTDADLQGKEVVVQTETYIKLKDWTQPLVLTAEAKWENKFIIEPSKVPPVITSIEPIYGYYNNLGALGLSQGESIDKAKMKPLLLRVKGKNFQVKREAQGGSVKKIYPEIEIWDNEGSNAKAIEDAGKKVFGGKGENSTKVLKVMKADGKEVTGQNDDIFGEIMLVQIAPENLKYELPPSVATTFEGGTYRLNANIVVVQESGTNKNDVKDGKQKPFEFRYRNVKLQNEILKQPQILKVVRIGSNSKNTERVFLSDEESEVEIYFPSLDIATDKIKLTVDGMLLNNGADFKAEKDKANDRYSVIKAKLPKGIVGKTKLQMISNDGLIDSYDLEFQSSDRPLIAELIPNEGQAGTWVFLKGDPKGQSFYYENGLVTKVLFNNKEIPAEVKDSKTIFFQVPTDTKAGEHEVRVKNPNGAMSPAKIFKVLFDPGKEPEKLKLKSIDPNRGDQIGGIPSTITVKEGKLSKDDEVYFGSQKALIIGTDLNFTKLYIRVPKFEEKILEKGDSYTVPVTVKKKSGVTDTIKEGFTYFNPPDSDKLKIQNIYKKDVSPKTNKGNAGDEFWVEGDHFIAETQGTSPKKVVYPDIYFGYEKAEILEKYTPQEIGETKLLPRILVRVPKQTSGLNVGGAVDVMLINPNGATDIKKGGFIYAKGNPQILSKNLEASRFNGKVKIQASDIFKDPLVIFGEGTDTLELGQRAEELNTSHSEIEPVTVKFLGPDKKPNFEIYYKNPDGSLLLMSDATDGGKVFLEKIGDRKIIKINWKNPAYHKNSRITENKELLNKLNDEYVMLELLQDGNINKLQVTRGLGKVDKYTLNPKDNVATLMVSTPYHEKIEKTKVTIVNTDGSSAEAPFTFNDSTGTIDITDIEGSSLRDVTLGGKSVKAKVKTRDVSAEGNIKILGSGFKDITSVKIGGKEVKVESLSPSGDFMIVTVPKGSEADVGKPLSIDIESKNGNVFSDEKEPPIYFMYIVAGSKPVIENLEPAEGPRTGGTRVKITGSGFREKDGVGLPGKIKLTVNGSAPIEIERFERDKQNEITALYAIMPKGETGKVKIQIINADEGTSDPKEFTYISQPVITKAGDAVFFNDAETEVTLTVEDLQEGAEVIIGAEMKKGLAKGEKKPQNVTAEGMLGVRNGENLTAYAIGGQKAKDVKVSKEKGTLSFKLPAGIEELEKMSVIIRNPDSGISEPKDNIIKPPIPDTPIIYAEPGAEGSVVLSWKVDLQALNAAEKFEVYAKLSSDSEYTFVGDTKQDTPDQAYIVKGLEHGTGYDFKVRVLNKYGEAKDLGYVRGFTLSASNDYKQQEKQAAADRAIEKIQTEGKQEIVGTTLRYTVGTAQTAVDFTKNGKYKEKQLQIPVRDILTNRGKVLFVTDGKINLQLSHAALSVPELSKASEDAFLRVSFSQPDKKKEDALRSAIGRKSTRLSPIYKLDFELVEPKKTLKIKQLAGTISIGFPAGEAGYPAEYMDRNDRFERLSGTAISKGGYYVLLKDKNK